MTHHQGVSKQSTFLVCVAPSEPKELTDRLRLSHQ